MKRALTALGISVALLLAATAICLPGICGCVSWLGIPDSQFSNFIAFPLYLVGISGIVISTCWLIFLGIRAAVRRIRSHEEPSLL
jgi:hypothetical protein